MVHIRRMELTNFKSFGGTTRFPLLPGFTVVTGPNGSGKSNIIDALLFALGLSTSKGMRADRLPDLINNNCRHRYPAEAWVTVVFDLGDSDLPLDWQLLEAGAEGLLAEAVPSSEQMSEQSLEPSNGASNGHKDSNGNGAAREWSVTRKLRVTKRETYTSTYYINGEACTLTELHEQLGRLRVYPEGYNVVLQGDVTNIITMNSRDRRQIIDELAGVGEFDRKITTAKQKLDEVKERLERSRILEEELVKDRDRLEKDRVKAERYRVLRGEMEQKQQQETVLKWRYAQIQEGKLREQIEAGDREGQALAQRLQHLQQEIQQEAAALETLNQQVKALGEDELLALQATLASQEAEYRQLEQRFVEQETQRTQLVTQQSQLQQDMERSQQTLKQLAQQKQALEREELAALQASRDGLKRSLADIQQEEAQIRETAEAWVREQTELRRRMDELRQQLDPLRTEEARLREQQAQLAKQIETGEARIQTLAGEMEAGIQERDRLQTQRTQQEQEVNRITAAVTAAEQEVQVQQETQTRLLQEQRDKQRQLDKLEAQAQALNESQGTYATQIILTSGMSGVRGIVAQLGQVEPTYQIALETAAGGRLGFVVVDNDAIAAAGIQLLKDKRAGRATFLPLNKLQASANLSPISAPGFVDYAMNLVEFHPQYRVVFAFVFGNTAVFEDLDSARRCLGRYRIVTLQGDLLEPTGAMTGGSRSKQRGGWSFAASQGTSELEQHQIRERLAEI
ncbi:AAA family ATPase, partial [bacterium]|nr:AAA family ATPase [bacterium]